MFTKATKEAVRLKIAIEGVTGAGKTYSALVLAKTLGGKVAMIDSERDSGRLYADRFDFDHANLVNHSIDSYRAAIAEAAKAGYSTLIIDSLSHEWMGRGGALEEVDRAPGRDKFTSGWRTVTPRHNTLIDDILAYPGHVIATLRKKMDYVLETNERGQAVPKKVGLAPVQRDGVEYEFTAIFDIEASGVVTITKHRLGDVLDRIKTTMRREDFEKVGAAMLAWASDGKAAPVAAPPTETASTKPPVASPPPRAAPAPASPPRANGAPSKAEQILIKLSEATTTAHVQAQTKEILALPQGERPPLMAAFNAAQERCRKAAVQS